MGASGDNGQRRRGIDGPDAHITRSDQGSWTIDAPNGFLTSNNGSNFFLPATVTQQLTDVASQAGGDAGEGIRTRLSESVIGYAALEEDNGASSITDGDTTGTITWQTGDQLFQRTVVTHGGQVIQDLGS